jgi:hypothetical protein
MFSESNALIAVIAKQIALSVMMSFLKFAKTITKDTMNRGIH